MQYLAIKNRKTGRFVSGTDFNYFPPHQIYASGFRPPLLLSTDSRLYSGELRRRKINLKYFRLVYVTVEEVERVPGASGHGYARGLLTYAGT